MATKAPYGQGVEKVEAASAPLGAYAARRRIYHLTAQAFLRSTLLHCHPAPPWKTELLPPPPRDTSGAQKITSQTSGKKSVKYRNRVGGCFESRCSDIVWKGTPFWVNSRWNRSESRSGKITRGSISQGNSAATSVIRTWGPPQRPSSVTLATRIASRLTQRPFCSF